MKKTERIGIVLFIAAPVFALILLCLLQNINPLAIDAWNTTWNDEVIYQKIIKMIRGYGYPTGFCSYNEVIAKYPAYGPWIFTTYIPYCLVSFFTGTSFHNFMIIANVIFIVAANTFFVFLVRPKRKNLFFLFLFTATSLIYERYVWSGMSESSTYAMIIIVMAIIMRSLQNAEKNMFFLGLASFLISFFALSRPFLLVYLLYIWCEIWFSKKNRTYKWICSAILFFMAILTVLAYFYLSNAHTVKYYSSHGMGYFMEFLHNKEIRALLKWILQCNIDAVRVIWASYFVKKWIIFVFLSFVIQLIFLTIKFVCEKDKEKKLFFAVSIISGLAIYEATVILYSASQLHRMLLGCIIGYTYIICMTFGKKENSIHLGLQILCMLLLLRSNVSSLYLPTKTEGISYYEDIENSMKAAMPFSEDDCWNNTVALIPTSNDLYLWYCFPEYSAFSMCTEDYLKYAITENILKSKYIYLKEDNELNELCIGRYSAVWNDEGYVIYENNY